MGLRTTDATTERLNESHDVQISSAYLANDVQSAATVQVAGGGNCSSQTTIVTFTYADSRQAVYCRFATIGTTRSGMIASERISIGHAVCRSKRSSTSWDAAISTSLRRDRRSIRVAAGRPGEPRQPPRACSPR